MLPVKEDRSLIRLDRPGRDKRQEVDVAGVVKVGE